MEYYFLEPLGSLEDPELCMLTKTPKGIGIKAYKMAQGYVVGGDYPSPADIHMSDEYQGLKLETLIGNSNSFLILHREAVEVVKTFCSGAEIEYLSFSLFNHRGRLHSSDYFIVNPIGCFDCLNLEASKINYLEKEIISIDEYVFDKNKLSEAPPLFRIPEDRYKYVVNEALASAFSDHGFTNIELSKLMQQ